MTKEHSVAVTGLSQVRNLKQGNNGYTPIAYFDATVNGIDLIGCVLVRTARRGIAVWPPKIPSDEIRRGVGFADNSLRAAIQKAARDVYRSMGGQHAEWEPHDDEPMTEVATGQEETEGVSRFLMAPN
jgi:hypothetical protein